LSVLLMLVACTSAAPIRWVPPSDFTLAITDNVAQQRFDLALISKSTTSLCLSKEAWPSEGGPPPGFDEALLNTAGGQMKLLSTGSAYCPGGCGEVRVGPGQVLHGALPYAAFGDAPAIASDPVRSLVFEVHPYICSSQ
jgi:hypothetical protein